MTQIILAASLAFLPVAMLLLRAFGPRWFTGPVAMCVVALVFGQPQHSTLLRRNLGEQMNAYGDNAPRELAEA